VSGDTVALDALLGLGLAAAYVCQGLRWLRVLQREHYDASSMFRFRFRWSNPAVASTRWARYWRFRPITLTHVLLVALVVTLALDLDRWAAGVTIAFGLFAPRGLSLKGRTGALVWTRRLKTVAVISTVLAVLIVGAGLASARPWILGALVVWLVPALLSATALLLAPYERRLAQKYVDLAVARLNRVRPLIVGITGSYGKTSTKHHLAALLSALDGVVSSPRSFNNRAGLSRAINETLADDTRVFIAEMGTYGPGEIAELCSWCPPTIAVVTAIGPVHLERMKNLDVVEQAKYEITESARCVVLNVDDERLAGWVIRLEEQGKKVRTAGSSTPTGAAHVHDIANRETDQGRRAAHDRDRARHRARHESRLGGDGRLQRRLAQVRRARPRVGRCDPGGRLPAGGTDLFPVGGRRGMHRQRRARLPGARLQGRCRDHSGAGGRQAGPGQYRRAVVQGHGRGSAKRSSAAGIGGGVVVTSGAGSCSSVFSHPPPKAR